MDLNNHLLDGKKGIIFGALNNQSIAWKVAERVTAEGASIVLTNTPLSLRLGTVAQLAEQTGSLLVPADATSVADLEQLVDAATVHFGGRLDFVLHAVGMSQNLRKGRPYEDVNYEFFLKTLDVSALSFHKLLQTLYKKDAMNEWGSVVTLTYIAADRVMPGYNDMADAKAVLQAITRNFGYIYGRRRHVRVNAVSQSPTPTTAGQGIAGMEGMLQYADNCSPLGNATAEDCAALVTALFSDLTRKVTMQTIYNDGGFSSVLPNPLA